MATRLLLLAGLPYAGKTTFARSLADALGLAVVSIDDAIQARGYSWARDEELTPAVWGQVLDDVREQIRDHLLGDKSVVYDSTNHDRESRDQWRAFASSLGFATVLLYVHVPPEVAILRRNQNIEDKVRVTIPEELFNATLRAFDSPDSDESPIVFASGAEVDEWLAENRHRLI